MGRGVSRIRCRLRIVRSPPICVEGGIDLRRPPVWKANGQPVFAYLA